MEKIGIVNGVGDNSTPIPSPVETASNITFDKRDKMVIGITSEGANENLVEISGYDLSIAFNTKHLNSIEQVEAAIVGLGDMFREIILQQIADKKNK